MVEKASIRNFGRDQLFIHGWDRQELWFSVGKKGGNTRALYLKSSRAPKDNKRSQGYKSMKKKVR